MRPRAVVCISALYLSALASPVQAEPQGAEPAPTLRTDTPSGFPVPRFVSLKYDETNCRIGPSPDHPIRFVFRRAGAPVMVVAESVDHWRKIRDSAGDECWAHRVTLRPQTHVLTVEETTLRRKPSVASGASAELARGVLARIEARKGDWMKLSADRADGNRAGGWIDSATVWGGAIASPVSGN